MHRRDQISQYYLAKKKIKDTTFMKCFASEKCYTSPPGSFGDGILQAKILVWVATLVSRGSSQPRGGTQVSCTAGGFFIL